MSGEQDRKLLCNTLVHQYGGQDEEKVCVFRMSFFLVTKNKSDASDHLIGITGTLYQCWTLSLPWKSWSLDDSSLIAGHVRMCRGCFPVLENKIGLHISSTQRGVFMFTPKATRLFQGG